jgi:hypothetical protein
MIEGASTSTCRNSHSGGLASSVGERFIPRQHTIKGILNAVVVIVVAIWLLKSFGLWQSLSNYHVGNS